MVLISSILSSFKFLCSFFKILLFLFGKRTYVTRITITTHLVISSLFANFPIIGSIFFHIKVWISTLFTIAIVIRKILIIGVEIRFLLNLGRSMIEVYSIVWLSESIVSICYLIIIALLFSFFGNPIFNSVLLWWL